MRFLNLRLQNFRNMEFAEILLTVIEFFCLGIMGKVNLICSKHLVWSQRYALLGRKQWLRLLVRG